MWLKLAKMHLPYKINGVIFLVATTASNNSLEVITRKASFREKDIDIKAPNAIHSQPSGKSTSKPETDAL